MLSFKDYSFLKEAAYVGNVGIMELIKFHQSAPPHAVKKIKELIAKKDSKAVWDLVQKHTGVKLHKSVREETV